MLRSARHARRSAGLVAVSAPKPTDGARAYDGVQTSEVPEDLAAALAANRRAQAFFAKLDGANRYAILWRVRQAKKAATRAEQIKKFVAMCARGERLHEKGRK